MPIQYKITEIFMDDKMPDTAARRHFKIDQEITTVELKRFCKAYGFLYEAQTDFNKSSRYIRALDIRLKVHVEAWST